MPQKGENFAFRILRIVELKELPDELEIFESPSKVALEPLNQHNVLQTEFDFRLFPCEVPWEAKYFNTKCKCKLYIPRPCISPFKTK